MLHLTPYCGECHDVMCPECPTCVTCDDVISLCAADIEHEGMILRVGDIEWLCSPACLARAIDSGKLCMDEAIIVAASALDTLGFWETGFGGEHNEARHQLIECITKAAERLQVESNLRKARAAWQSSRSTRRATNVH